LSTLDPVRRLLLALAADANLGHPPEGFYRVDYWPGWPPDAAALSAFDDPSAQVVVLVEDDDEVDDVRQALAGLPAVTVRQADEDGEGSDVVYVRSGPFDSVVSALVAGAEAASMMPPGDDEEVSPDDRNFLRQLTDARLREHAAAILTTPLRLVEDDLEDPYLAQVLEAFPGAVFVVGLSAEPPLHDFAMCVITAPQPANGGEHRRIQHKGTVGVD
jgi:hypothetical protein